MEMSRQRLRTGVLEATTAPPHCGSSGPRAGLLGRALGPARMIEDEAAKGKGCASSPLYASQEAAICAAPAQRASLLDRNRCWRGRRGHPRG
jgi:ribonuclease E